MTAVTSLSQQCCATRFLWNLTSKTKGAAEFRRAHIQSILHYFVGVDPESGVVLGVVVLGVVVVVDPVSLVLVVAFL